MALTPAAKVALGVGLAGGLAYIFRNQLAEAGLDVFDFGKSAAFKGALQIVAPGGVKYADEMLIAGREWDVNPFLLAAIMDRESHFGATLSPANDPAGTGDGGHGRGLMQIDDRSHKDFIASGKWKDPLENIRYGASVLAGNIAFFKRSSAGPGDPRPLSGDALLKAAVASYNTGAGNVLKSLKAGHDPDTTTAHGNYASDVLGKLARYTEAARQLV